MHDIRAGILQIENEAQNEDEATERWPQGEWVCLTSLCTGWGRRGTLL